uniref:SUN domain-containing protein n=1 Tax=Knipowitschia caucasica TaxID=637954 RepID=A0AAV2LMI9_KNICA
MSRRSTRLLSDEESDSSSVTTISYRENPVKVFKKKSGGRKKSFGPDVGPDMRPGSSRTSLEGPREEPLEETFRAPVSAWSGVRPALRSSTFPPFPQTSLAPLTHLQVPSAQSAVDSSGYSSSEEHHRGPSSRGSQGTCVGALAASRLWLTNTVSRVKAKSPSSVRMNKWCALLLLLPLLFGAWWWSLVSGPSPTASVHRTSPQPMAMGEMRLKHNILLAELRQQMKMDLQEIKQWSSEQQLQQVQVQQGEQQEWQRIVSELQSSLQQELQRATFELQSNLQQEQQRAVTELQSSLQQERQTAASELQSSLQKLQADAQSLTAGLLLRLSALEEQMFRVEQRAEPQPLASLTPQLKEALDVWLTQRLQDQAGGCGTCGRPLADEMADFALESQGASVVSTRCSETYHTRSACVSLFGVPLWYPSESPRTVIQGPAILLPGKCWAFHGVQGTLVIALSHPITISHVSLDHLPRHSSPNGRIDSAPKDFQVYGMSNETEAGTLLGTFMYKEDGEPTQTFSLSDVPDAVYRMVELRVLSNWGHVHYTCVYRFRVHGQLVSS